MSDPVSDKEATVRFGTTVITKPDQNKAFRKGVVVSTNVGPDQTPLIGLGTFDEKDPSVISPFGSTAIPDHIAEVTDEQIDPEVVVEAIIKGLTRSMHHPPPDDVIKEIRNRPQTTKPVVIKINHS